MKVVKVYGALKKRLGQSRFEFDVATPAEAIRALCANFPGLQKWIIDSEQDGIGYKVKVGKELIAEENIEELYYPWSEKEVFSITPVLTGAGRGFGKILVGALLIGAAILLPGAAPALGWGGFSAGGAGAMAGFAATLGNVGLLVTLSGVAEMLSPSPPSPDMSQANALENYSFSGITNVSQVGTPVPIAYGRLFVGSSVISSGLDVDQIM
jgi:predicted phage tail protein